MKKYLFVSILMLMSCIFASAQTSLIATLSHEGEVRAFYGNSALASAHAAAVDGDIITLSSGNFNATNITKAITLRGAGMLSDVTREVIPTVIQGTVEFNISDTTHRLEIEGLKFSDNISIAQKLVAPLFQKCIFPTFNSASAVVKQGVFSNCYITDRYSFGNGSNVTFINSYVSEFGQTSENTNCYSFFDFQNCVIRSYGHYSMWTSSTGLAYIKNSTLTNCVIVGANDMVSSLPNSTFCYNCVATGTATRAFNNVSGTNNIVVDDISSLMREFNGTNYNDNISFALTDDAASTYLGTDGTQVGIFGGLLPFDPMPYTLQITKCNVANKSTADGKLSVEIEVSGIE
ncbi:MAG: hypothetical protein J6X22_11295 [Muribaculaceae bacterium]|nr:hypothetical protein [Muribaculaceae bacterium]